MAPITRSVSRAANRWPTRWFVYGAITLVVELVLKIAAWKYQAEGVLINIPRIVSFNMVYVENRHSAFGMMRSIPTWANTGLLILSVVFLVGLTVQLVRDPKSTTMMRRGIFCFVIGAIGNMGDRLTVGAVVDYIDFRLGDNGDIYSLAWNISDLVINLGFAHIMYEVLFTPKPVDDKKAVDQTPPQSPPAAKAAATKSKTATKRKSQ